MITFDLFRIPSSLIQNWEILKMRNFKQWEQKLGTQLRASNLAASEIHMSASEITYVNYVLEWENRFHSI